MKTLVKLASKLIPAVSILILLACDSKETKSGINAANNLVVLVKYKAQPDKGNEAETEITSLIEKVKKEPYFVDLKLHVDPSDNTNILLYETWGDESYYKGEHMKTEYLQEFIANSRNFLAGPPDISFWKVESEFKK